MDDALELVLGKLDGVRQRGGYWSARCPAHEDTRASLSVGRGTDQPVVLKCHAGCDQRAIIEALGLSAADISKPRDEQQQKGEWTPHGEAVAVYDYVDENGSLLFQVCRTAKKDFSQRVPDARKKSGWRWSLGTTRRVPYRLPKVIAAAVEGRTVYIAEGEKDVQAIERAGGVATCNPMGAGKWRDDYDGWFRGAEVVIVADADEPGRKHAADVAAHLRKVARSVRVAQAAEGKDAADHLAAGHGLGEFRELADDTASAAVSDGLVWLDRVEPERVAWLWAGRLPLGKLVILDGDPGVGKSTLVIDWIARLTTGTPWPDGADCAKGKALIMSAEDGAADTIRPRLDAAGGDPARAALWTEVPFVTDDGRVLARPPVLPGDIGLLEARIAAAEASLVMIDVLMAYLSSDVNSHRDQDVRGALHRLAAVAERTRCCIVILRHLNKSGGGNAIYRGGGSIGIIGQARAAFIAAKDPADESGQTRVLACTKMNIAREPGSFTYMLTDSPAHGCARVEWGHASSHTAADLLDYTDDGESATADALGWLQSYLMKHGGEALSSDAKKAAVKDGISERTLKRAIKDPSITVSNEGFPRRTVWRLHIGDAVGPVGSSSGPTVPLAGNGGVSAGQLPLSSGDAPLGPTGGTWPEGSIGEAAQ